MSATDTKVILIVDDEAINLSVLTNLLKPFYTVCASKSGEDALRMIQTGLRPDLILLDIMLGGIDGYATLSRLRENPDTADIPVIFISMLDSDFDEDKGLKLGAVDYIVKPFRPLTVLARVNTHLELKQTKDRLKKQNLYLEEEVERRMHENRLIQDAALIALAQLAETRDKTTGNHIMRTYKYVEILARRLQTNPKFKEALDEKSVRYIIKAAPLHDIGKIGIPDSILLKPARLTPEEFEVIKTHCQIGGSALHRAINEALNLDAGKEGSEKASWLLYLEQAEIIANCHHERWDGNGYPFHMKAGEIPLAARLMALADVYDALTTPRPYKPAWSFKETAEYIISQRGTQFDPDVVDAFLAEQRAFETICQSMRDE